MSSLLWQLAAAATLRSAGAASNAVGSSFGVSAVSWVGNRLGASVGSSTNNVGTASGIALSTQPVGLIFSDSFASGNLSYNINGYAWGTPVLGTGSAYAVAPLTSTAIIAQDSFESGNLSYTNNGFAWGNIVRTSVNALNPKTGTYALEFKYQAAADNFDSNSEQRFTFGNYYKNVWAKFVIFIPTNYVQRSQTTGSNNKWFVDLWQDGYGDNAGVAFDVNLWSATVASFFVSVPRGTDPKYNAGGRHIGNAAWADMAVIKSSDRGKWLTVVQHFKYVTNATSNDGAIELWITPEGEARRAHINKLDGDWYIQETATNGRGANNGYLMGWANTGYLQETKFYIDSITFATFSLLDDRRLGDSVLKLTFGGGSLSSTSLAKVPFTFGQTMEEVYMEWDQYFPSGDEGLGPRFYHQGPSDQNELLTLWANNETVPTVKFTVGSISNATTAGDSYLYYSVETNLSGLQNFNTTIPFLNDSRRGTWVTIKVRAKTASAANNNGILQIYIGGALLVNVNNLAAYTTGGTENFFKNGALMGTADSGFSQNTNTYIDNFTISSANANVVTGTSNGLGVALGSGKALFLAIGSSIGTSLSLAQSPLGITAVGTSNGVATVAGSVTAGVKAVGVSSGLSIVFGSSSPAVTKNIVGVAMGDSLAIARGKTTGWAMSVGSSNSWN